MKTVSRSPWSCHILPLVLAAVLMGDPLPAIAQGTEVPTPAAARKAPPPVGGLMGSSPLNDTRLFVTVPTLPTPAPAPRAGVEIPGIGGTQLRTIGIEKAAAPAPATGTAVPRFSVAPLPVDRTPEVRLGTDETRVGNTAPRVQIPVPTADPAPQVRLGTGTTPGIAVPKVEVPPLSVDRTPEVRIGTGIATPIDKAPPRVEIPASRTDDKAAATGGTAAPAPTSNPTPASATPQASATPAAPAVAGARDGGAQAANPADAPPAPIAAAPATVTEASQPDPYAAQAAEAEKQRKAYMDAQNAAAASMLRQQSAARAKKAIEYAKVAVPAKLTPTVRQQQNFGAIGEQARRVGDMARRQDAERAPVLQNASAGDPCAEAGDPCAAMANKVKDELEKERKALLDQYDRLDKQLDDLEKKLDAEEEREKKSPERKANKDKRAKLDKERKDLDDERDRLDEERDRIDDKLEKLDEQDKDLRAKEDAARRGPPADPNCNSAECRKIQAQRAETNRERWKTLGEQGKNQARTAALEGRNQAWERESADLEKRLDRGEGMTRTEWQNHMLQKEARAVAEELRRTQQRIYDLDEKRAQANTKDFDRNAKEEFRDLDRNIDRIRDKAKNLDRAADRADKNAQKAREAADELERKARQRNLSTAEKRELDQLKKSADKAAKDAAQAHEQRDAAKAAVERHQQLKDFFSLDANIDEARKRYDDVDRAANQAHDAQDRALGEITDLEKKAGGDPEKNLSASERRRLAQLEDQFSRLSDETARLDEARDAAGSPLRRHADLRDALSTNRLSPADDAALKDAKRQVADLQKKSNELNARLDKSTQDLRDRYGGTFGDWAAANPAEIAKQKAQIGEVRKQIGAAKDAVKTGKPVVDAAPEKPAAKPAPKQPEPKSNFADQKHRVEAAKQELDKARRAGAPGWKLQSLQEKVDQVQEAQNRHERELLRNNRAFEDWNRQQYNDQQKADWETSLRKVGSDAVGSANGYVNASGSLMNARGQFDQAKLTDLTRGVERAFAQVDGAGAQIDALNGVRANFAPGAGGEPSAAQRAGLGAGEIKDRLGRIDATVKDVRDEQRKGVGALNAAGFRGKVGADGGFATEQLDSPFARAYVKAGGDPTEAILAARRQGPSTNVKGALALGDDLMPKPALTSGAASARTTEGKAPAIRFNTEPFDSAIAATDKGIEAARRANSPAVANALAAHKIGLVAARDAVRIAALDNTITAIDGQIESAKNAGVAAHVAALDAHKAGLVAARDALRNPAKPAVDVPQEADTGLRKPTPAEQHAAAHLVKTLDLQINTLEDQLFRADQAGNAALVNQLDPAREGLIKTRQSFKQVVDGKAVAKATPTDAKATHTPAQWQAAMQIVPALNNQIEVVEAQMRGAVGVPALLASLDVMREGLIAARQNFQQITGSAPAPQRIAARTPAGRPVGRAPEAPDAAPPAGPRAQFGQAVGSRIANRLDASPTAKAALPAAVVGLADKFGAKEVDAAVERTLGKLPAKAGVADFTDALAADLGDQAKKAKGADGATAAKILRVQLLSDVLAPSGAAALPPAETNAVKARLKTAVDDLAAATAADVAAARRNGDNAGALASLSRLAAAAASPGLPAGDLRPVLRDIETTQNQLNDRQGTPTEAQVQAAATSATSLGAVVANLGADAPADVRQSAQARYADALRLTGRGLRGLAGGDSSDRAASLRSAATDVEIRDAQARAGLGRYDEALAVLKPHADEAPNDAARRAAAQVATLSRAAADYESLSPAQRGALGDRAAVQAGIVDGLRTVIAKTTDPQQMAAAAVALADVQAKAGDAAGALRTLTDAANKAPADPVVQGQLLSRRIAGAGADQVRTLAGEIPDDSRSGAVSVALGGAAQARDAKAVEGLASAIATPGLLPPADVPALQFQTDLARLTIADAEPMGPARDARLGDLLDQARARLDGLTGLAPEAKADLAAALDTVAQQQKQFLSWQKSLISPTTPSGEFGRIARDALLAGRPDIAAAAAIRDIGDLGAGGDRDDVLRRTGQITTMLRLVAKQAADPSLPPAAQEALKSFADRVGSALDSFYDGEAAAQADSYRSTAKRASQNLAAIRSGDAEAASQARFDLSVSSALRDMRALVRNDLEADLARVPEADRRATAQRRLADADAAAAEARRRIADAFAGLGPSIATDANLRAQLDERLANLNLLRARRDAVHDYLLDTGEPMQGTLTSVTGERGRLSGRTMTWTKDVIESPRFFALIDVETRLNGFATESTTFQNYSGETKHGARPRRGFIGSKLSSDSDPNLWRDYLMLQDEENYLERRAVELVREDTDLSAADQDARLAKRFANEAKRWKEWGTSSSPLTLSDLTGMGEAERRMAADRAAFIGETRMSNLQRDLDMAHRTGDAQKGFAALVQLRQSYLAGERKAYVDYLNTEWYRRGPVFVKRLAADAAATEDELRAVTRDSMRLHAALTRASALPVEALPAADRNYLEERGFIADGRYRLPADFKVRPTEAGTTFSERGIIDQYVNAGTVGELTATVVLPGGLSANVARGAFGRLVVKDLVEAGATRAGAAWVARWGGEKAIEAALFTGLSRGARTALHPMESLQNGDWSLSGLGSEYLHNLAVISALKLSGSATRIVQNQFGRAVAQNVENTAARFALNGTAGLTGVGVEAGVLTGIDQVLSGNTVGQDDYVGNALTVLLLRGIHVAQSGVVIESAGIADGGRVGQIRQSYKDWIDAQLGATNMANAAAGSAPERIPLPPSGSGSRPSPAGDTGAPRTGKGDTQVVRVPGALEPPPSSRRPPSVEDRTAGPDDKTDVMPIEPRTGKGDTQVVRVPRAIERPSSPFDQPTDVLPIEPPRVAPGSTEVVRVPGVIETPARSIHDEPTVFLPDQVPLRRRSAPQSPSIHDEPTVFLPDQVPLRGSRPPEPSIHDEPTVFMTPEQLARVGQGYDDPTQRLLRPRIVKPGDPDYHRSETPPPPPQVARRSDPDAPTPAPAAAGSPQAASIEMLRRIRNGVMPDDRPAYDRAMNVVDRLMRLDPQLSGIDYAAAANHIAVQAGSRAAPESLAAAALANQGAAVGGRVTPALLASAAGLPPDLAARHLADAWRSIGMAPPGGAAARPQPADIPPAREPSRPPQVETFDPTTSDTSASSPAPRARDGIAQMPPDELRQRRADAQATLDRLAALDSSKMSAEDYNNVLRDLSYNQGVVRAIDRHFDREVLLGRQAAAPLFDLSAAGAARRPMRNPEDGDLPQRHMLAGDNVYLGNILDGFPYGRGQNDVLRADVVNAYVQSMLNGVWPLSVENPRSRIEIESNRVVSSGHHRMVAAWIVHKLTGRPLFAGEGNNPIVPDDFVMRHTGEPRIPGQPWHGIRIIDGPDAAGAEQRRAALDPAPPPASPGRATSPTAIGGTPPGGAAAAPRASYLPGRQALLHDVIEAHFGGKANIPSLHVTDGQALAAIARKGVLEAPARGGASWSPPGIGTLREGNVAIRIKPGHEGFIEWRRDPNGTGLVPIHWRSGKPGVGQPTTYVPVERLQYFDAGARAGEERWVDFANPVR
ncbi:MAG: hypothetical protein AB7K86_06060 [Rhodospirillales bacterium]